MESGTPSRGIFVRIFAGRGHESSLSGFASIAYLSTHNTPTIHRWCIAFLGVLTESRRDHTFVDQEFKLEKEETMKSRTLTCITAMTLFAALAIPVRLAAQGQPRYKVVDVGTFGGPNSNFNGGSGVMNNSGTATGAADTAIPDPYSPNCFNFDCFVQHAFRWQNGVLTDLGTLPGGTSSYSNNMNSHGQVVGQSQNGLIDPLTGIPEVVATVWKDGQIVDLGSLGRGFSLATADNNLGQAVGCAFNAVPDSFSSSGVFYGIAAVSTQMHAFLWQNGPIQDLGTLGGPDSCAVFVNERGQIAGASFTNSTVNPATGLPTLDPFLWENGRMLDLGTLGGTLGLANIVNNRGQVVGESNLAGDAVFHAFFWDHGTIKDLGTLGGSFSVANWLNDAGEAVGGAGTGASFHASVWRNGVITDLGTLPGDCFSVAGAINSRPQIVGQSFSCDFSLIRAVLWDKGLIVDLNTFVPPGSGLTLTEGNGITDAGEIAAVGLLLNGDQHAVLLIPCGADETEGCQNGAAGTAAVTKSNPAPVTRAIQAPATAAGSHPTPSERVASFRARLARRYHIPGALTRPAD